MTPTAIPFRLAPQAALRPERFGALVYNHDNRRLCFIHSHMAADFIGSLDGALPLGEAIDRFVERHGLEASARDGLLETVGRLERLGVVEALSER